MRGRLTYANVASTLAGGENPVGSLTFTAPTAGKALVTWAASFSAAQAGHYLDARVMLDGQLVDGAWLDPGDVDGTLDLAQAVTSLVPVGAGEHTVTVTLEGEVPGGQSSSYTGNDMTALFIPG